MIFWKLLLNQPNRVHEAEGDSHERTGKSASENEEKRLNALKNFQKYDQ